MFTGVGLVNPKHSVNVGAVLRAANCYWANFIVASGRRYKRAQTDTSGAIHEVPLFQCNDATELRNYIPFDCVPIAVDLLPRATCLVDYEHPDNAFYIFGPEDGTLGSRITGWCRDTIYVPTKACMNLAATVNVVLYDRFAKQLLNSANVKVAESAKMI